MGQIISHPTVFPDESIYYTSCMRNDNELTDVFKISTDDKVEEELLK
ncbi:MAG: hypothetical protein R2883_06915 [Caldisericia bacterium]